MTARPNPDGVSLEDLAWLRRLALHLVRDECEADDLTQEAVLKALDAGRFDAPRSWWRAVLRNAARDRAKTGAHRRERELDARPGEEPPTPHAVVEAAETQQRVADAVLALDEPYRTVLLLRYFEGLPQRRIARELERPASEVKAQLEAGRARLRRRLGREFGRGGALAVALLPIAGADRAAAAVTTAGVTASSSFIGGVVMAKGTWIAAAAAGVLVATLVVRSEIRPVERDADAVVGRATAELQEPAPIAAPPEVDVRKRAEASAPPAEGGAALDAPYTVPTTPAIALDLGGRPLVGVEFILTSNLHDVEHVKSDGNGRFQMQLDQTIEPADERLAVLGYRDLDGTREVRIVPTVRVAGEVVDERGRPVNFGHIVHESTARSAGLRSNPAAPYRGERGETQHGSSSNRFNLERITTWPGKTFSVYSRLGAQSFAVPSVDTDDLVVTLDGVIDGDRVTVRVLDERGLPAPDGQVCIGYDCERMDSSDELVAVLYARPAGARHSLTATRPGYMPVEASVPEGADVEVEVAVTERALSLKGRVVNAKGDPVVGVEVCLWDGGTPLGSAGFAEVLVSDDPDYDGIYRTDSEGRFEIRGLADRAYTLRAIASDPLRVVTAGGLVPGDPEPVLHLPDSAAAAPITGRVVDVAGTPLEGATVAVVATKRRTDFSDARNRWTDQIGPWNTVRGATVETDAEGLFRIEGVIPDGVRLSARKRNDSASAGIALGETTIVVDRGCDVTARLEPSDRDRQLAAADETGRYLRYMLHEEIAILQTRSPGPVRRGTESIDLIVSQATRALVLLEGDREVARVEIEPDPDASTSVEL
ncbi:MAG: sigma-70 family RNA polymerase sigma factor [Planctomycetota bacterium]